MRFLLDFPIPDRERRAGENNLRDALLVCKTNNNVKKTYHRPVYSVKETRNPARRIVVRSHNLESLPDIFG